MTAAQSGNSADTGSRHLYSIEYQQTGRARTPDIDQSIIDLYRSYSNGGIVAFVGSGASASLGHCSWDELATGFLEEVVAALKSVNKEIDKSARSTTQVRQNTMDMNDLRAGLGKIIEMLSLANKSKKKKEGKLDTFDVLSITANALQRAIDLAGNRYAETIRERVREHYKKRFSVKTSKMIDDDFIALVRDKSEEYREQVTAILAMIEKFDPQTVTVPVNKPKGGDSRIPDRKKKECRLVPVDYAAGVELLWKLVGRTHGRKQPESVDQDPDVLLKCPLPSIDVLGVLRNEWKIGRYVTLNFDHEIERMLERTDYPFNSLTGDRHEPDKRDSQPPAQKRWASHQVERAAEQSRLGARARVVDLNKENSAELMLFAANCPAGTTQVLHLHGSKHRPEDMIITDGDYNRRYYANDAAAAVLSDGQELLFRANAIIFVGVGMKEDELLRASRILAQAPGRDARPIYALMAFEGEAKNQALRVKLYQRYGIHVLFYGSPLKGDECDEEGNHHQHPLVRAAAGCLEENKCLGAEFLKKADSLEKIAGYLQPISKERDFLEKLRKQVDSTAGKSDVKLLNDLAMISEHFSSGGNGESSIANDLEAIKDSVPMNWPRLTLTPWHNQVFRLVCRIVEREGYKKNREMKAALLKAIGALDSAIMGRALTDALQHLSIKAMAWKKRWQDLPQQKPEESIDNGHWQHLAKVDELLFRRKADTGCNFQFAHNVSHDHTQEEGRGRPLLEAMLTDKKGEVSYGLLLDKMRSSPVVIANRNSGDGKGIIATKFAFPSSDQNEAGSTEKTEALAIRIVVSFGASCSRDSMLDLIADLFVGIVKNRSEKNGKIEIVLSRFDLLFTKSESRPKLVEWQIFMNSLFSRENVSFLLLCSGEEVSKFFDEAGERAGKKNDDTIVQTPFEKDYGGSDPVGKKLFAIVSRCGCVWAASFLSALHAEIVLDDSDGVAAVKKKAFFEAMMEKMWHALNQTQDPQQRTPALLDVAISELENYIFTYRNYESRRTKVLAHAILKHLFAFGGPVAGTVLPSCPEIRQIFDSYAVKPDQEPGETEKAIKWLIGLDMITVLCDCFAAETDSSMTLQLRYGLHGHMRNYLAVKKGLPFSMVLGREQTAMTLLPIIDEEVVPLQPADYDFIWDLFDSLVRVEGRTEARDTPTDPENIRAAFMLLRGSMRVGTVLRAKNEPGEGEEVSLTPLDRYFRSLLEIRHAVLQWAGCNGQANRSRPLYEREWIWLFNEMGIVKLLQGHVDDASSFFEQAAEFERDRIRRQNGYEWFEHRMATLSNQQEPVAANPRPEDMEPKAKPGDHAQHFTIGLCRILLNLAISEIERGAFDRAERLLRGRKIDFVKTEDKLLNKKQKEQNTNEEGRDGSGKAPDAEDKKNRPHREMRLLKLVCGLIEARVKFLSGASGETAQWLRKNEEDVVAEGVPGLTSWYYLIRADIELRIGNLKEADSYFKTAHAEAEASGRSDLILSVMIGESQSDLKRQRYHSGVRIHYHLSRIHEIKQEARRMGMARVLVSASMTRARLYLSLGEYRSARYDMMSAIALSNANGLNIKRVSSLILMAALVGSMGDGLRGEAQDITDAARFEADRIGYQLAAMYATELEIVLREGGSIEDWAAGQVRSDAAHSGRVEWLD